MRDLLLIFSLLIAFSAQAQKITLSATVQDSQTQEPLPFASVGIKGKSIGTITNLQGQFDFHFPAEYRNEILVISMLGYENFEAPIWSLLDSKITVIPMPRSTTMLKEVEVRDSLSGGEILRLALEKIEAELSNGPVPAERFLPGCKEGWWNIHRVAGSSR